MKKLTISLFSALMFMALSYTANAQFGARAGINLANISIESEGVTIEGDNKFAFHAGLTYEHMLSENLYLRPGALFSIKGYEFEIEFLGETIDAGVTTTNIEIPIDFVYKLAAGSNKVGLHAGPYLGMLMGAEDGEGTDVKEGFKSLDFGLNIGATFELNKISLGINYGLGLANIAETEDGDDTTATNRVLAFFVGYAF